MDAIVLRGETPPNYHEPRICTIPKTVQHLHESNPYCGVTVSTLRRLVKDGLIPSRRIGNRFFVDENEVTRYYSGGIVGPSNEGSVADEAALVGRDGYIDGTQACQRDDGSDPRDDPDYREY